MNENDLKQNLLQKKDSSPMWKTFMITDLDRIERLSGKLHARLEPKEPGIGYLDYKNHEEVKKEEKNENAKTMNLLGEREVFLKPAFLGGKLPSSTNLPLLSRTDELLLEFNNQNFAGSGLVIPKLKGLKELRDRQKEE